MSSLFGNRNEQERNGGSITKAPRLGLDVVVCKRFIAAKNVLIVDGKESEFVEETSK